MYLNNMQFLFVKLVNIYELAVLGNPAARVSDEGHWNDYLIFLSVFGSLLVEIPRGAPKAQIAILKCHPRLASGIQKQAK